MKVLKITLLLVAVLVLTVSGVQSKDAVAQEDNTIKEPTKLDLVAHGRKKVMAKPSAT